jgi:hypothetical protein
VLRRGMQSGQEIGRRHCVCADPSRVCHGRLDARRRVILNG